MSNIIAKNTILVPIPSRSSRHLFIVLTSPDGEPPVVVMVNITTKRGLSDRTVILRPGDHSFIKHESVIAFEHADMFELSKLENGLNNGLLRKYPDVSDALFTMVKNGLLKSSRTPQHIKNYCRPRFST